MPAFPDGLAGKSGACPNARHPLVLPPMCGRMTMTHPNDAMARLFEASPSNDLPEVPRYNICPTQDIGVVT